MVERSERQITHYDLMLESRLTRLEVTCENMNTNIQKLENNIDKLSNNVTKLIKYHVGTILTIFAGVATQLIIKYFFTH